MVSKLPRAQKRMFWRFEKGIFQFFANFWVTKLKLFSVKVRQSLQDHLNSKLVIGSYLENGFEATLWSESNVLSVCKGKFLVFCNFWVTKLKSFSGKVRQNIKNCLNQNLVIGSFIRFWSKLEIKMECSEHLECFSDEVETIFWESEAKH